MSVNSIIIGALATNGYPVEFNDYDGSALTFFTFNFADERGGLFCDDQPEAVQTSVQIHFFSPKTFNHLALKNKVRNDLLALGFSYPTVITLYEDDSKLNHLIFECEYVAAREV
jgi:hypothetical protein